MVSIDKKLKQILGFLKGAKYQSRVASTNQKGNDMALLSSVMFLQNSHVKTAFYPPSCIKLIPKYLNF